MDPDDRPYSLGWATAGCVEPKAVHEVDDEPARREAGIKRTVEDFDQEDLDTWWAGVCNSPKPAPRKAKLG